MDTIDLYSFVVYRKAYYTIYGKALDRFFHQGHLLSIAVLYLSSLIAAGNLYHANA
jgi:hypothetical protein